MMTLKSLGALGLAAGMTLSASTVHAHASYNIAGYGSGIGGSANGADGTPGKGAGSIWTNGDPIVGEYTGNLPVMWYDGLHSVPTTRVLQTGGGIAAPANGSLLQQTNAYNVANDPDLPTDRVLAVGGLSWADPDNGGQGWGHGLDYGLIHVSPVDTILAGGPVKLTVSLQDDPTDGVVPRLAMALYGNWDSSASSSRHQTFTTQPAPTNAPLGATGLVLLGYAVGSTSGGPVTLSINVDATYGGEYTLMVGALGGVAGQYIVTTSITADTALGQCQTDAAAAATALDTCTTNLGTCNDSLDTCTDDLAAASADADNDGVIDAKDTCPGTPSATSVDATGCSQAQFCGQFDVLDKTGAKSCKKADWKNDEPLLSGKTADCLADKRNTQSCIPAP